MKSKILFIERKFWEFVSIEKVFEQIARNLNREKFEASFTKVSYGNNILGILKNLLFFRKAEADIYHITGHIHYLALVLPRKKTVLTIHDLRFLQTKKKIRRYILKKLFLDLPVKKLKYVTAISETTKNEIVANTGCDADKIKVIENPLDENFSVTENKREFNENCPTILQIGTMENKNIPNLVKALEAIKCKLVIIGRLNEQQSELLQSTELIFENRFDLNDSEIKSEYEQADIVSFCSTYEGFGLPIIESQAMRKSVITSNLSPMKEVSGGAAYLADPNDYLSIREGILQIIGDKNYREKLIRDGVKNISRFKSQNIAQKYEELYRKILNVNG
jgi:glycosyltransferase involved in cell wall biosynthesis